MPNNSISWAIDLLPNADLTYNLGKVDNSNSDNNRRWNIFGNLIGNADSATTASKLGINDVGSNIIPIYLDDGVAAAGKTYAGGTAVTLNGASKAENTAEFYAPTTVGTSGYILKSNGSGAPTWLQILPIANGGTGTSATPTQWGIIYASSTTSYACTNAGGAGKVLIGNGTGTNKAPSWYDGLILGGNSTNGYTATVYGKIQFNNGTSTISTYGDAYTPIYWNDGKPAAVMPVQYKSFTINGNNQNSQSVDLTSPAFTSASYVLEIAINAGTEQFLESPITWTSYDSGNKITLTTKVTNGEQVTGYIIVSRGGSAPALSS